MLNLLTKIKNKVAYEIYKLKVRNIFNNGYASYLQTGTTTPETHRAFTHLYRATNGKWNEQEQKKIQTNNPSVKISLPIEGTLDIFDEKAFANINQTLNKDGYMIFHKKLPKEVVSRLYKYATETRVLIPPAYDKKINYDPNNLVSEIYRFNMADLLQNEDIQSLIMDPVFINIARNYFGSEPIFDGPNMWWNTAFLKEASTEAAQLYHFDLERIKWLKMFIYLNDVTGENGPHRFIKGTHLPGSKPPEILKRGYVRVSDAELQKYYEKEDFIEVCGEAGTIFVGDTKCWHKGSVVKKSHRLALELQYTSSLFGANRPVLEIIHPSDLFRQFCNTHKFYASNIQFKN